MAFFDSSFDYRGEFIENWNRNIKKAKWTLVIVAAIFVIIGICLIAFPLATLAALMVAMGIMLIISGIWNIIAYCKTSAYFRDPVLILNGVLDIILGVMILTSPVFVTVATLAIILGFELLFSGIRRVAMASRLKFYRIMNTTLLTISGVIGIVVAVIYICMPYFAVASLNYILAFFMIADGIVMLFEAFSLKPVSSD